MLEFLLPCHIICYNESLLSSFFSSILMLFIHLFHCISLVGASGTRLNRSGESRFLPDGKGKWDNISLLCKMFAVGLGSNIYQEKEYTFYY